MKYLRSTLLVLLLAACVNSAPADKDGGFFFVQIADPQIGFSTANRDLTPDIESFQKAVRHINRLKPAFVVISGDLINTAHNPKQIRAFWRVARQIRPDIPIHLVAGNHDVELGTEAEVRSYRRLFGEDYYSFSYRGSEFIVLDSSVIHYAESDPDLRRAQRSWFEAELAAARRRNPAHIFILTHHPWFVDKPEEDDSYFNIPQTQRRDYLALMERYGVDFAVAGHRHEEALGRVGKLTMITTSALSKALGQDPLGFRVFRVYDDRVEHRYYALDQVPERIE